MQSNSQELSDDRTDGAAAPTHDRRHDNPQHRNMSSGTLKSLPVFRMREFQVSTQSSRSTLRTAALAGVKGEVNATVQPRHIGAVRFNRLLAGASMPAAESGRPARASAIERAHHVRWIALPWRGVERKHRVQCGKLRGRGPDRERVDIFVKVLAPLGTGDRHDVVALREHARECELTGRTADLGSNRFDLFDQREVLREVLPLEARG